MSVNIDSDSPFFSRAARNICSFPGLRCTHHRLTAALSAQETELMMEERFKRRQTDFFADDEPRRFGRHYRYANKDYTMEIT